MHLNALHRARTNVRGSAVLVLVTVATAVLVACDRAEAPVAFPEPTADPTAGTGSPVPGGAGTFVDVDLTEWAIELARDGAPAERNVTFIVTNNGVENHELVVIRSDGAVDALPVENNVVPESAVDFRGEVESFPAGRTERGTFALEAGRYLLICNLPLHYEQGMRVAFTVE